jgi:hypothetical protein
MRIAKKSFARRKTIGTLHPPKRLEKQPFFAAKAPPEIGN